MARLPRRSGWIRTAKTPPDYQDLKAETLSEACSGCAHCDMSGEPSGERPCQFCTRNPKRLYNSDDDPAVWYNGAEAIKVPMDCYHSHDFKRQVKKWSADDAELINHLKEQLLNAEEATSFCGVCDNPAAPDDYLCWEHRAKALMGRES